MPGWHDFDIGAWLRTDLDVPVHVDNDVNLMALGEQRSSWPDVQDLVFVKVATGIGAGIIAGGQLQRGAHGGAGDLGHIKLARGADVRCRCGNRGCLVALASGPAIADSLRAAGAQVASPQDVVDAVRAGNLEAIEAVRQAGRDIGEVLAMSVSLINPSVIALGGTMSQIEHLVVGVREEVYSRAMPLAAEGLQIVRSAAGSVAGLVGAGTLAVDHVIADLRSGRR
jgi:glucokinase